MIVGNHDVGFHYDMIDHKIKRFNRTFSGQFAKLRFPHQLSNVNFLMLNSMALENDGCKFCTQAQRQLQGINSTLECLKLESKETNKYQIFIKETLHKNHMPILFLNKNSKKVSKNRRNRRKILFSADTIHSFPFV